MGCGHSGGAIARDIITLRLNNLLEGKSVNGAPGKLPAQRSKNMLRAFVTMAVWDIKHEAFDAIWHAVFDIAKKRGWKASLIRDATYYWTAHFLAEPAWDSDPDAEEEDEDDGESCDDNWIATAFGDARLFSLGYAYSPFAMNALLDGLGWEEGERNSDSMRMGSCAQLLSAGRRIKLHVEGGGNDYETPGFGGTYLRAQPSSKRDRWKKAGTWEAFLKALDDEQAKAGPRAAALLKVRSPARGFGGRTSDPLH
jgi:hypothetical protein